MATCGEFSAKKIVNGAEGEGIKAKSFASHPHLTQYLPLDIMCPQCHRLFTRDIEEKEIVDEETIYRQEDPPVIAGPSEDAVVPIPEPQIPEELVTYRYRYKCKHCGNEWTDIKKETLQR